MPQEKKLGNAQPHFDATWKKFQEAIDVLPEGDRGKKLKPIQVSILHMVPEGSIFSVGVCAVACPQASFTIEGIIRSSEC